MKKLIALRAVRHMAITHISHANREKELKAEGTFTGNTINNLPMVFSCIGVNTPFKFAIFVREGAAPLPCIKGDRD